MKASQFKNSVSLRFILAFFALQFIFSLILLPLLHYRTILPFTTWDLFSSPERIIRVPLIYIQQVNSRHYEPPLEGHKYFRQNESNVKYLEAHDVMSHEVAEMHQRKNTSFSVAAAERVARIFWGSKDDVKFEIRLVQLHTVDFFLDGAVLEYNVLGAFHFRNNSVFYNKEALEASL